MLKYAVLLALLSLAIWRFAPRIRVTWFAVLTLFTVIVAVRAAQQQWA